MVFSHDALLATKRRMSQGFDFPNRRRLTCGAASALLIGACSMDPQRRALRLGSEALGLIAKSRLMGIACNKVKARGVSS